MGQVTVRYYASASAAAGLSQETLTADSVDEALTAIRARHSAKFVQILDVCSVMLNGVRVDDGATPLPAEAELDVLPPFAGG